ncbi:hypothetical protein AABC73_06890 [Pseudomonas sp. G.S.17]|uniref:hypothetical protein n=1 Tax=Pseudomonas sp. G.S.17 TaxID=3137451 RepID=UPI00311C9DBA
MLTDSSVSEARVAYWFVGTPAVIKNGVAHSRMIHPFATAEEAENGAELLNGRYPDSKKAHIGQLTYQGERSAEDMEQAFRVARGDLADQLAGPDPRSTK